MDIKVTKIGKRWHARLIDGNTILDEMACSLKEDIGWICREMLRWQDKMGNSNGWTSSARRRQTPKSAGKVWFQKAL
jgi:hypothetical protein